MNRDEYLAACVVRGATLLDAQRPGWDQRISTATLDLADNCHCILGQLYGTYARGVSAWSLGLDLHGAEERGFHARGGGSNFRKLEALWVAEIRRRADAPDASGTDRLGATP